VYHTVLGNTYSTIYALESYLCVEKFMYLILYSNVLRTVML